MIRELICSVFLAVGAASAAPLLEVSPSPLPLTGAPGERSVFSFRLIADTRYWISVVGSSLINETNPSLGLYEDIIGSLGGPDMGLLAPGSPDWLDSLGAYNFDTAATPGAANSGRIIVFYDLFDGNPIECGDCQIGSGQLTADVAMAAVETPEPSTWALVAAALALCYIMPECRRIVGSR